MAVMIHHGSRLDVAGKRTDSLEIVDPVARSSRASVGVEQLRYGVLLDRMGTPAVVTNWGGTTVSVVDVRRAALAQTGHDAAPAGE